MKILIVYEEVPETTKIFSVEVTPDEWKWMKLTHDCFVNGVMPKENEEACNQLSEWLEGKICISSKEPIALRGESYDYFLHTGFLL